MIHERPLPGTTDPRALQPPLVLVADEDESIRDLLHLAFSSHQWRVITAADGDEALQRALSERPDIVVLSHPLPRKSGLEVCDYLRHDPEDPNVPVLLLSTLADPDLRLEALRRGADDVLSKPFSPRELLARGRRLLVRVQDARRLRRERRELERDLQRARAEGRRAALERDRERELRALATGAGRELHERLATAAVARHLLLAVRNRAAAAGAALCLPSGGAWECRATSGPTGDRLAGFPPAALARLEPSLLAAAGPRSRPELERGLDRDTVAALAGAGVSLALPLVSPDGLEGAILVAERRDGLAHAADVRESLGVLAQFGASALRVARRLETQAAEMLERWLESAGRTPREVAASREALAAAHVAAERLAWPAHRRRTARLAVLAGGWGWSDAGRAGFADQAARDASGLAADVWRLVDAARELETALPDVDPQDVSLVAAATRAAIVRASGRSAAEAWTTALGWVAPAADPRVLDALRAARPD